MARRSTPRLKLKEGKVRSGKHSSSGNLQVTPACNPTAQYGRCRRRQATVRLVIARVPRARPSCSRRKSALSTNRSFCFTRPRSIRLNSFIIDHLMRCRRNQTSCVLTPIILSSTLPISGIETALLVTPNTRIASGPTTMHQPLST